MAKRIPLPLRAYRGVTAMVTPLLPLLTNYRLRRGKELPARIGERRGIAGVDRPELALVWIHAASVGELLSIVPIAEYVRRAGFGVLVTSGTVTSARLAEQRLHPDIIHQFSPLDSPRYVRRFFDYWQPDLGLFAESDLWPNLISTAAARNIPLILVNGRVSERSFRRWKRMPRTIGTLLRSFDLCLAQTVADAERYAELGAPRITTTGNLKLDAVAPPAREDMVDAMRAAIGSRPIVAAASTHPGEEAMLIEMHKVLRQRFPGLLTIIAPRHPERGPGIVSIAQQAKINAIARSRGYLPDRGTEIYVADTMGELGVLYRVAPVVLMGGSMIRHGGQNPIEPAKLGAAVLHGPHVWNFQEVYGALDRSGGAIQVADTTELQEQFVALLTDQSARDRVVASANVTLQGMAGARAKTLGALDPYLMTLRLNYS